MTFFLTNTLCLRQTRLAVADDGTLYVKKSHDLPAHGGRCAINELPLELLTQILHEAARLEQAENRWSQHPKSNTYSCPLVCKHWRLAHEPVSYRTITISLAGLPATRNLRTQFYRCLHQAFIQHSSLGGHVRELKLELQDRYQRRIGLIIDIINSCPGIRYVNIHLAPSIKLSAIFEAAGNIPRLEKLKLGFWSLDNGGIPLQLVLTKFKQPSLKKVHLSRVGLGDRAIAVTDHTRPVTVPEETSLDVMRLIDGSPVLIETLELSEPYVPAAITEMLLTWPKALVHLRMNMLCHANYRYNVHNLQKILDVQRHSLQTVALGVYPTWREFPSGIPDFSQYSSLRYLKMSMDNLLSEDPKVAATKLTAPSLVKVCGDFATEDQHEASLQAFGSAEHDWLVKFASCKTFHRNDQHQDGISGFHMIMDNTSGLLATRVSAGILQKLETMQIEYHPQDYWSTLVDIPWPWKEMQKAREVVSRFSLNLIYEPTYTEQDWAQKAAKSVQEQEDQSI